MLSLHSSDIYQEECACSCFYRRLNLKSVFTVLNSMKRTSLFFGNFALSVGFLCYSVSTAVFWRCELGSFTCSKMKKRNKQVSNL